MSKQDVMKMQTCVLRVNIHCEGCKDKIRKLLKKTEGVYSASIDAEQDKVTVTGLVDPYTLIKKLEKSGKHAELWGGSGGPKNNKNNNQQFNQNFLNLNDFKNLQMENIKGGNGNKSQKGNNGKDQQKGGNIQQQLTQQQLAQLQQQYMKGGAKDLKLPAKEQKTVRFNLPEEDFGASEDEFGDEFDDEYDDEFGDELDDDEFEEEFGHGHHQVQSKQAKMGGGGGAHGHQAAKGKGDKKGDGAKGGKAGSGKTAKKGGLFDIQRLMKVFGGGGGDGKKGKEGKKNDGKNGGKNKGGGGGGKNGGKNGGDLLGNGGKNGFSEGSGKKNKGGNNGGGGGGGGGGGKKGGGGGGGGGGGKSDGAYSMNMMQPGFLQDGDVPHHGKAKGGGGAGFAGPMGPLANYPVGQMGHYPMGQMGHIPAVQGLPMNGGYYQGMGPVNPYSQQQYMGMMMNQQPQAHPVHGSNMFPPMMYARPQAPAGYFPPMPPPASDPYVHMFSDENTDSCSIM